MHYTLSQMQQSVTSVAEPTRPHAYMQTHLPVLSTLHQYLEALSQSPPQWPTRPSSIRQSEQALLVTHLTALLTSLVPQLDRLGARLSLPPPDRPGRAEEQVFWALWRFAVSSCASLDAALDMFPELLSLEQQPFYPPLYVAMNSVLAWVLTMSRSPAWLAMTDEDGLQRRNRELLLILAHPVNLLNNITSSEMPLPVTHSHALPASLVPFICCIMTEQFGEQPLLVSQPSLPADISACWYDQSVDPMSYYIPIQHVLTMLIEEIINFVCLDRITGHGEHFQFLTAPALSQLLKAVVILTNRSLFSAPELIQSSVRCLVRVLFLVFKSERDSLHTPVLPQANRLANRDAMGLPLHTNPCLSRAALETDIQLLHVLWLHNARHPSLISFVVTIQSQIAMTWVASIKPTRPPTGTLAMMIKTMLGVSKHVTLQALKLMMLEQMQRRPTLKPLIGQPPVQEEKVMLHKAAGNCLVTAWSHQSTSSDCIPVANLTAAGLQGDTSALADVEVLSKLRNLVYLTSHFQLHIEGSMVLGTEGERHIHNILVFLVISL